MLTVSLSIAVNLNFNRFETCHIKFESYFNHPHIVPAFTCVPAT